MTSSPLRSDGRKAAEHVVEGFNLTGSLQPAGYGDITRHASHFIPLLAIARGAEKGRPQGTHA